MKGIRAVLAEHTAGPVDRAIDRWVAQSAVKVGERALSHEERWEIVADAVEAATVVIADRLHGRHLARLERAASCIAQLERERLERSQREFRAQQMARAVGS